MSNKHDSRDPLSNDAQAATQAFSPGERLRRLRKTPALRSLLQEVNFSANDFIYPMFVCDGQKVKQEISSMPGQFRMSLDVFQQQICELAEAGVRAILLFGVPNHKDEHASGAVCADGLIQKAISICKQNAPQVVCISDICVCEFTSHGHCGYIENGDVLNDQTLELLATMALSHAQAGVDMVAPSAMMDYQVAAIRQQLDLEGFKDLPIMAYSSKFSSAFYGPFREAANSAPQFGDRKSYQMNPANAREALREIQSDVAQGADIIMVKPALAYMDIIQTARRETQLPVAVYNVSGEYAMIKAAAERGWIDEKAVTLEMMLGFKRAGADLIISYSTPDLIRWIS